MRRAPLLASLLLLGLVPATAAAQGSGIRGVVLDATCAAGCEVECPPPPSCRADFACALSLRASAIACPLAGAAATPLVCTRAGCPGPPLVRYPPYEGEGLKITVRPAGESGVISRRDGHGGRYSVRLPPGTYVVHAWVALPCWAGQLHKVKVRPGRFTEPRFQVRDNCAAQSAGRRGT
ncbi:MAG: hypothetical protein ACOYD4_03755 [Solirubrobacterales bacterium]